MTSISPARGSAYRIATGPLARRTNSSTTKLAQDWRAWVLFPTKAHGPLHPWAFRPAWATVPFTQSAVQPRFTSAMRAGAAMPLAQRERKEHHANLRLCLLAMQQDSVSAISRPRTGQDPLRMWGGYGQANPGSCDSLKGGRMDKEGKLEPGIDHFFLPEGVCMLSILRCSCGKRLRLRVHSTVEMIEKAAILGWQTSPDLCKACREEQQ